MANYGHIIIFSLIGGVFSLTAAITLLSKRQWAEVMAKYGTPFAAGALLAAVFLDLLKEGVGQADVGTLMTATLAGMIIFFFAERFLHWFHHHRSSEDHSHEEVNKSLIIVGDTLHNALDGVAIAASFLISVPTGIITTIAVALHEIPQEIGDFGLLLKKGMRRRNVLIVNILSALATLVAALITFSLGSADRLPLGVLLGVSAGFLLYIAASDIIPSLHEDIPKGRLLDVRPFLLLIGAVIVGVTINFAHGYIDAGHDHEVQESHQRHEIDNHEEGEEDHGDHDH